MTSKKTILYLPDTNNPYKETTHRYKILDERCGELLRIVRKRKQQKIINGK